MKSIFVLFCLIGLFSGSTPARSETQLPINELFPCEVVLHELIADLRKLRVVAKHTTVGDQKEQASHDAAVQAYDEAISAATKKFDRCP